MYLLVYTDYNLPKLNFKELLKKLKTSTRKEVYNEN